MKASIIVAVVIFLISASIGWEIRVWNECRATNSWLYCVRILQK